MTSHSGPTVSVCIPAYNEERNIDALLTDLRSTQLSGGEILEVLVDVSGSTDRTAEIVRSHSNLWRVVRAVDSGERDGLLRALDRLIHMATGSVVVRIDADVRLHPACLERLLQGLSDPEVGIVGPRIVPGPSRSPIVRWASRAEWAIHDHVSRRQPKTTVVQAFRRLPISLPADSGLEDAGLQQQVERSGYRAAYVPGALVFILPPSNVRGMLLQRIRTIRHIRDHVRRGYARPATASPTIVWNSLRGAVQQGQTTIGAVAVFGAIEAAARVSAGAEGVLSPSPLFGWEPVEGTKDFGWSVGSPVHRTIDQNPPRPLG